MNNELTKKDIQEMLDEIEYRKVVVRKEALEDVKQARAHGDLSENFEYHAAKKVKNQNESRIRYLEKMIKTARVYEDTSKDDEVGINKTVTLFIPAQNLKQSYTIVSTIRGDSLHNFISVESPLGKSLLGHKVGDTVNVVVNPNFAYDVNILEIVSSDKADEAKIRSF